MGLFNFWNKKPCEVSHGTETGNGDQLCGMVVSDPEYKEKLRAIMEAIYYGQDKRGDIILALAGYCGSAKDNERRAEVVFDFAKDTLERNGYSLVYTPELENHKINLALAWCWEKKFLCCVDDMKELGYKVTVPMELRKSYFALRQIRGLNKKENGTIEETKRQRG